MGLWAATGFYIVPEGQSGIVTTFGKYTQTTMPGFRWHLPWPIEEVNIVDVSSVRTVAIGAMGRANREAEALMLTDDENIVDLRFNVQYRIKSGEGAMNYIFRSRARVILMSPCVNPQKAPCVRSLVVRRWTACFLKASRKSPKT